FGIRALQHQAHALGRLVRRPGRNGGGIVVVVEGAEFRDRAGEHLAHGCDIRLRRPADSAHLTTASSRTRRTVASSWPRLSTRPSSLSTMYWPCLLRSLGFFSTT